MWENHQVKGYKDLIFVEWVQVGWSDYLHVQVDLDPDSGKNPFLGIYNLVILTKPIILSHKNRWKKEESSWLEHKIAQLCLWSPYMTYLI
jgi:hypothetical protein